MFTRLFCLSLCCWRNISLLADSLHVLSISLLCVQKQYCSHSTTSVMFQLIAAWLFQHFNSSAPLLFLYMLTTDSINSLPKLILHHLNCDSSSFKIPILILLHRHCCWFLVPTDWCLCSSNHPSICCLMHYNTSQLQVSSTSLFLSLSLSLSLSQVV